jgi:hypothetical protein
MAETYITIVNEVLRRANEVEIDESSFNSIKSVQTLAKDAVNASCRHIIQRGQQWPFLATTATQVLVVGQAEYSFPADYSSADWQTFFLKSDTVLGNSARFVQEISFDAYTQYHRIIDDEATAGDYSIPLSVYPTVDGKFGFTPLPNAAYSVEYRYYAFPTVDLVNASDVFATVTKIPDRFKHIAIDGAMMYLMRYRSNEQSAMLHEKSFHNGIEDMRRLLLQQPPSVVSKQIVRSGSANVFNQTV